jgi:hypothetical protein
MRKSRCIRKGASNYDLNTEELIEVFAETDKALTYFHYKSDF